MENPHVPTVLRQADTAGLETPLKSTALTSCPPSISESATNPEWPTGVIGCSSRPRPSPPTPRNTSVSPAMPPSSWAPGSPYDASCESPSTIGNGLSAFAGAPVRAASTRMPGGHPRSIDKTNKPGGTRTIGAVANEGGDPRMDVRFIGPDGVTAQPVADVASLLCRDDGMVWVDIPVGTTRRNAPDRHVQLPPDGDPGLRGAQPGPQGPRVPRPRVRGAARPPAGVAGHVHYVELDQFIGPHYLVTVHGPLNPAVDPPPQVEVDAVLHRLERAGCGSPSRTSCPTRWCPRSPAGCGTTPPP